jgi:hypothetical protein
MTAIPTVGTLTEVSYEDAPYTTKNGTGRRRIKFIVRVTSAAADNTLDVSAYIPNLGGIEGFDFEAIDGAAAATKVTWTGTTITFAGHTGSGVTVLKGTGYYT